MSIGLTYTEAANLPLPIALALLDDVRQKNTHQKPTSNAGKTYVATGRRHSKK